jgi:predicted DNA-binding WGR domain protein
MWERFETTKGKIRWFFEIKIENNTICSRCGPVGAQAMTVRKAFPETEIKKAYADTVAQKVKEGYQKRATK